MEPLPESEDEISEALNDPLEPLPESEDEISEALNDPLEPLPESEDEISEALNDPLEPLPESEDEISEALNDPLEPLPESEDEISEALNDPLEPLPESEDEISEALNDPLEPLPESEDEISEDPSIKDDWINLASSDGFTSLEVTVTRDAEFDNYIGFYRVEDEQLRVRDPLTGTLLSPGDPGYREAAISASIDDLLITAENGASTSVIVSVDAGLLGLFIAVDVGGQPLEFASEIYFTDPLANSDGLEHVKLLDSNTFGFEDASGGGDLDYNDMIVHINFPNV